jgi:hypothetical protein
MKEYIDKTALMKTVNTGMNTIEVMQAIINAPAADVVEVRKAKWITGNENPRTYGRIRSMCGRCGAFALYEFVNVGSFGECLSNYCPNCGAKMDGGVNDV